MVFSQLELEETKKIRKYINHLEKNDIFPDTEGAEKFVYIKSGFVFLKYKKTPAIKNSSYEFRKRKHVIDDLIKLGVNTPKIRMAYVDKKENQVEVQLEAPGRVLYYRNEKNAIRFAYSHKYRNCVKKCELKDLSTYLKKKVGEFVADYCIDMQKQLKNATKGQFVKFLRDYKTISNYGINIDYHGENILYSDEKGFYFIDIDENIRESRKQDGDALLVNEIINMIGGFLSFKEIMPEKKVEIIKKNNYTIFKMLFDALKTTNYKITDGEFERLKQEVVAACGYSQRDVLLRELEINRDFKNKMR